ncbi:ThiF family adenylyltransferase [Catenulispora subtropica]|uniref:UBA/THIF-type NAD/FAD binding protein n=1 Tax=Catenulispora subtropica TaxID=450798 RepID=A0ABP5CA16_9ACTN
MLTPVRVADYVLDAITARIGAVAPEQGGALLGLPGLDYVTGFLHDAGAATTGTRYQNTDWLIAAVAEREAATAARFKGIVHSHPAGMPVPSGQDRSEYAESLRLNPHLARYLAPIVTHDVDTPLAGHELRLGPARISFYGAERTAEGVQVAPVRPVVVPIVRMLRRAGVQPEADPAAVEVEGAALLATHARIPGFGGVTILFGTDFPATAPTLLAEDGDGPLSLVWDLSLPPLERMAGAVPTLRTARRPRPRESHDASHDAASAPLFARTGGLLSPTLARRRVLIVGAGSVGSYVAETMARSGVGAFTIVDPDVVEPANVGRSAYRVADVGLAKARALADLVLSINPRARVARHTARHEDLDLAALVAEADLVIAATDDPQAQARLGHFAHHLGRPAVFPGLYQGAQGGEVIIATPGTPCFTCATGGVRADLQETASGSVAAATDYGTGRLIAEPGLLTDIHQVSAAAVKIALGLLHDADDEAAAARFAQGVLKAGTTYAVFGHEPDYWIFADLMRGAPAQYAYQSLWLSVEGRPGCPVCGEAEGRTDPGAFQEPDVDVIRALTDSP